MRNRKSNRLNEGFLQGLRDAQKIINKALNESADEEFDPKVFAEDLVSEVVNVVVDLTHNDPEYGGNPADYFDTEVEYINELLGDPYPAAEKLYKALVKSDAFADLIKTFLRDNLDEIGKKSEEAF